MKPPFLDRIEELIAINQHGILSFNTTDRCYWPEKDIGPSYLCFFLASYFGGQGYRVAEYAAATGLIELNPEGNAKGRKNPFQNRSDRLYGGPDSDQRW